MPCLWGGKRFLAAACPLACPAGFAKNKKASLEDRTPVRQPTDMSPPNQVKITKALTGLLSFVCCEGEDRTPDLRVMSPTSYRCSTSRCGVQR
jgi:hypothetical protein